MKFVAVIESSINWTEEFDTVDEAIEVLRGLVEADKRYTFAGTTNFHFQSHGKNASKAMQVKWLWTDENGKPHTHSKNIRIKDYTKSDERITCARQTPREALLDQWDSICAMFR